MKNIKDIEHTADIGFKIKAKNLKELFQKSGNKIINLALKKIKNIRKIKKRIILNADTIENLLHKFLNEILYLIFVKKFYVSEIKIRYLDEEKFEIEFLILGNSKKDKIGEYILRELKSVTFHNLKIKKLVKFYETEIVIDT
jgi:SHS2 domain-containing protein